MEIGFEMTDDILVAGLAGELDHHFSGDARKSIDKTMDAFRAKNLILDFSGLTFMDSAGAGMVMGRYNRVQGKGGRLFITGCSPYIYRILEMAGIFTIAEHCETAADGIGILKSDKEE